MNNQETKVISIRLIYVILFFAIIIFGVMTLNNTKINIVTEVAENKNEDIINEEIVVDENLEIASIRENTKITTRSENLTRAVNEIQSEIVEEIKNNEEAEVVQSVNEEVVEEEKNYISISDVKISKDMDLTVRTGLSKEDFMSLIADVKADTSGFFEENAGKIYDLCEQYELNEIFFCGVISAESGWDIAKNHRSTFNYISLMKGGKLIRFSSVDDGLESAAKALHNNYLTKGGKYYYGKTLSAVKTKFCPASSTWVDLVYGRMKQIIK